MPDTPDPVAALLAARLSGQALPAFPTPVPATLAEAYDVQQRLTAALGAPVLGWKVGRIPPALVETLGQLALAGQPRSRRIGSVENQAPDRIGDILKKAAFGHVQSSPRLRLGKFIQSGMTSLKPMTEL